MSFDVRITRAAHRDILEMNLLYSEGVQEQEGGLGAYGGSIFDHILAERGCPEIPDL